MYASYNMLYNDPCGQTPFTAHTDRSRFACGSLPVQSQVRKSIQDNQLFPLNTPCVHDCPDNDANPSCRYSCSTTKPPQLTATATPKKIKTKENFVIDQPQRSKLVGQDYNKLLPVMDPRFNLREICKQSILLEDHLCHNEKRCFDCCVKHFLTIEALAEEAITLDPDAKCSSKIQNLPSRIRDLQSKWHQDPENNALPVSQELRKIRKDFQIDAFDIVFSSSSSCKDGVCQITRR